MDNASGLEHCKRLIETSLGWGDSASWTNEDFDSLSDRIFERTSVSLSVSTLKRIWGKVKYDSSPTTATLNALARFAGFEGWRHLLAASQPAPTPATPNTPPLPTSQTPPGRKRSRLTPLIIVTTAIA